LGDLDDALDRLLLAELRRSYEALQSTLSGPPPDAIMHREITEVYQVLEGSGILVTGGMMSEKEFPAELGRTHTCRSKQFRDRDSRWRETACWTR